MNRDIWKVNERRKLVPIISEGLLVQDLLHLHVDRLIEEGLRLRRAVSHLRTVFRIEIIIIAGTVPVFTNSNMRSIPSIPCPVKMKKPHFVLAANTSFSTSSKFEAIFLKSITGNFGCSIVLCFTGGCFSASAW